MKVTIVIPARNEEANIEYLLDKIVLNFKKMKQEDYEIIVVNDNSTDESPQIMENYRKKNPKVRPVHRTSNPGFGNAVLEGFKNISCKNDNDLIIPMCADCSDNPNDLPKLIAKSKEGYDIVYAGRKKFFNYPPLKLAARRLFNLWIKTLFALKQNDITNFYKAYRYRVFKEINKKNSLKSEDFSITAELPIKAHLMGFTATEISTFWFGRAPEGMGSSKLHLERMGYKYAFVVLKIFLAHLSLKLFHRDIRHMLQI